MARRYVLRTFQADVRIVRCSSPVSFSGDAGVSWSIGAKLLIESDRDKLDAVHKFCELLLWREPSLRKATSEEVEQLFRSQPEKVDAGPEPAKPLVPAAPGSSGPAQPVAWDPLTTTFPVVRLEQSKGPYRYVLRGHAHPADLAPAIKYVADKRKVWFGLESSLDWSATAAVPAEMILSLDKEDEEAVRLVADLICTGEFTVSKAETLSPSKIEAPPPGPAEAQQASTRPGQAPSGSNSLLSNGGDQAATSQPPGESHVQTAKAARSKEAAPRVPAAVVPTHFLCHVPDFVQADWHYANPTPRQRGRGRRRPLWWWFLHILVIQQRAEWVIVPDVLFGQVVWGNGKKDWPKNWRDYLGRLLGGKESPLKCQRACAAACPMHDTGRHGHFHFRVRRPRFLGALENFGYEDESGDWRYDFGEARGPSEAWIKQSQEQIDKDRKAGRIAAVYLPLLIFGPAARMKLPYEQQQLLLALTRELTRGSGKSRPDRAAIITGGQKTMGKEGTRVGVFPHLQPGQLYVTFGGNASHQHRGFRGRGYRLIGRRNKGWLHRAGYNLPTDSKGRWNTVAAFLKDLDALAARFGLVAAGWHPAKRQWRSLADMRAIVNHRDGQKWLDRCLLRVYTPADYLVRWRQHFAEQMGFTAIPGGQEDELPLTAEVPATTGTSSALELDRWMNEVGLSNQQLATELEVTAAWVSKQRTSPSGQGRS
jgi:hypothetical protein